MKFEQNLFFYFVCISFLFANFATLMPDNLRTFWIIGPVVCFSLFLKNIKNISHVTLPILLMLFYLIAHSFVLVTSMGFFLGLASFLTWGAWITLCLYLKSSEFKINISTYFMYVFYIVGIIHAGTILYETIFDTTIIKTTSIAGVNRRFGIGESVSQTGVQIGVALIVGVHFFLSDATKKSKIVFVTTSILLFGSLFLAGSRGPLIFSIASVILYILLRRAKNISFYIFAIIFVVSLITIVLPYMISENYISADIFMFLGEAVSTSDLGNMVRFVRWQNGITDTIQDPFIFLFGHGSGTSATLLNMQNKVSITHESSFVKLFYETGFVGLSLLIITLFVTLTKFISSYRKRFPDYNIRCVFFAIFCLVVTECLIHDMLISWLIGFYLWICIGMIIKSSRLKI